MAALIQSHDWAATSLGPSAQWPQSLKSITGFMIRSPVPMVLLWGPDGVMIYNDGYSVFAGGRHPWQLGQKVCDGWPEVADFNANVMKVGLAGGTLSYQDQELTLHRHGNAEQVWMNLDYTPVLGDDGEPAGVMAIVIETTGRVLADRRAAAEQAKQRQLLDQMPGFAAVLTGPEHVLEYANEAYAEIAQRRDLIGRTVREVFPELVGQKFFDLLDEVYATGERFVARGMEMRLHGSEEAQFLDFVYEPVRDENGTVNGVFVGGYDATEVHRAVEQFQASEIRATALLELEAQFRCLDTPAEMAFAAAEILGRTLGVSRAGYGTIDPVTETITIERDWNAPGVRSLAGTLHFRDYGSYIDDLKRGETVVFADAEKDPRTAATADALTAISARSIINMPINERDGFVALLYLNDATAREWPASDLLFVREVAQRTRMAVERRRAELDVRSLAASLETKVAERTKELMEAEAALRQSQKMEAVGQLTGGIAHDFNNLLAGISGSLELLEGRIAQGRLTGLERYIDSAQGSTRRAAALTQRLLAFSRRQTLDPKPTDVNRLVAGLDELLRRTIGPNVALEVVGAGGIWATKVDPSQLENTLLNLCLNARDAMPDGGRITIETANKWLDDRAAQERELPPGQYVSICVTDTGTGMTPDVIAQAFDPFFTTKPLGQGTGLGLSMVHGFVRQSGGQVRIYSELGEGTTMCLYLPRFTGQVDDIGLPEAVLAGDSGHGETVLVIDDEPTVRMLIVEVLEDAGYFALEAEDGPSGLRILQSDARVDLLITDVGLPGGMNGRQVADAARITRPGLKVLFVTGYAENAAVGNGLLEPGMQVITKPFAMTALGNKVREMIEG